MDRFNPRNLENIKEIENDDSDQGEFDEQDNLDDDYDEDFLEANEPQNPMQEVLLKVPGLITSQFASPIMKLNNSGNKWNNRMLVINQDYLGYIRKVPVNNEITEKDIPKQCVHVSYILDVGPVSDEEAKKYKKKIKDPDICFKVELIKAALYKGKAKEPKMLDQITEKMKSKPQKWFFMCEVKEDRNTWINKIREIAPELRTPSIDIDEDLYQDPIRKTLEKSKEESKGYKNEAPKDLDLNYDVPDEEDEDDIGEINERFNNANLDEDEDDEDNDDQAENAKNPEIQYSELKNTISQYLTQSNELLDRKIKKEEEAWDMKFQNYWTNLINFELEISKQGDDSEEINTKINIYCERLLQHVGKFRKESTEIFQKIVEEMSRPESKRTNVAINIIDTDYLPFASDDDCAEFEVYKEKNIIFKIAACDMEGNLKWKQMQREFNSMDAFFDTLYILSKDEEQPKLRVPLSCIMDYKGFRCLATGLVPFDEYALKVGFNQDNKFLNTQSFMNILSDAGHILGLKDTKVFLGVLSSHQSIPISTHLKVYHYRQTDNSDNNFLDSPTVKSKKYHFSELQYDIKPNQDLGYVFNTSYMFPLDFSLNQANGIQERYIRPEFLCQYERPLKADTRKLPPKGVENRVKEDQDMLEINEASKTLQSKTIPNLVSLLDSLTLVPLDSKNLSEIFHSYGINMRYLGIVARYSNLFHVQDICINEMIARILKQLLNAQIASSIKELSLDDEESSAHYTHARHEPIQRNPRSIIKTKSKNDFHPNRSIDKAVGFNDDNITSLNRSVDKQNSDILEVDDLETNLYKDNRCNEWYQDFLNLTFGNDKESEDFFHEVVYPRIQVYYSYPVEQLKEYKINYTALYYSLLYHCGLQIDKEQELYKKLGKTQKPFEHYNYVKCVPISKTYPMRKLPVHDFANKYKEYRARGENEMALHAAKARILYTKLVEGRIDLEAQGEIAELLVEEAMYDEAIEQAEIGLQNCGHENSSSIKFYCVLMRAYQRTGDTKEAQIYFDKTIMCLVHHWGQLHPLHCTIYNIMAFLMIDEGSLKEAEYCYMSSLSCCSKVLGTNHIQTAEVYMDFGRLYLKMHRKSEALVNFQAAFNIYQSYFEKQSLPCGNAGFHIATILEEERRLHEAFEYAQIAVEAYSKINGQASDLAISSQWLIISISFSLKSAKTEEYSAELFRNLNERDQHIQSIEENKGVEQTIDEETRERIERIKEYLAAVDIMNTTRNLDRERRTNLKAYVEAIMREEDKDNEIEIGYEIGRYGEEVSQKPTSGSRGIDPIKVSSISNLTFTDAQRKLLNEIYEAAVENQCKGVFDFYYDKIKEIVDMIAVPDESGGYTGSQKGFEGFNKVRNEKRFTNELNKSITSKSLILKCIRIFEDVNFMSVILASTAT
ncbi:unnamed protein product [Moneuplotes crassus]|uniref:Clu domain-containing protein n=2 Tax=Euplotes crassus TaxID=5936 RepID=A0AAD1X651_EUPCR|nr:unnamed protein product [Moneuplotes crassus]